MANFVVKETLLTEDGAAGDIFFDQDTCGFNLATIHAEHELWVDPVDNGGGPATGTVSIFNPIDGTLVTVTSSWVAGEGPVVIGVQGVFDETGARKFGPISPIRIKVSFADSDGTSRVLMRSRITGY